MWWCVLEPIMPFTDNFNVNIHFSACSELLTWVEYWSLSLICKVLNATECIVSDVKHVYGSIYGFNPSYDVCMSRLNSRKNKFHKDKYQTLTWLAANQLNTSRKCLKVFLLEKHHHLMKLSLQHINGFHPFCFFSNQINKQ